MKRLYVVFDIVAAQIIGGVMLAAADAAAIRSFGDACSNPESFLASHPKDFELRCVGTLDEDSGAVTPASGGYAVVLTGEQWHAMQSRAPELVKEA